jgi:hypothetical protein
MKLTKAEYDALPAALKKLFKADGDDYVGAFQTEEEVSALKNANERNKEEMRQLKQDLKELKDNSTKAGDDDAKRKGDIEALEKSWGLKLTKAGETAKAEIEKRDNALRKLLVTSEAARLAGEISTAPHLVEHFIAQRLAAEFDGDMPKTRVLGADGKPSALTLDDLKKDFLADKRFESILIGSKGSGGGAGGTKHGSGGFKLDDFKHTDGSVNWTKVNAARKSNPEIVTQVQEALQGTAQA